MYRNVWQTHFNQVRSKTFKRSQCPLDCAVDIGCDGLIEIGLRDSKPHALDVRIDSVGVPRYIHISTVRITRIVPGSHTQHERDIFHRARHWSDMIHGPTERHDAAQADEAVCWLQACDSAHGGRDADGATGCGTDGS